MTTWLRDLLRPAAFRQSLRALRHRPAYTTMVVVTLACGTAMITTAFGIVDAVLIRPLPYPHADRLVTVYETSSSARSNTSLVAPARLVDWNRFNRTFEAIAGAYTENVTDTSGPSPERLEGRCVTPGYFTVFGVQPAAGRTFAANEEQFGGPGVVVISDAMWARRYQRDPGAIGRRLLIGGAPFTIVGAMPPSFTPAPIDVWLPAQLAPGILQNRDARFVSGVGRMRPGVTIEQAGADLARVQQRLGEQFSMTDKDWSVVLDSLKRARVGGDERPLWLIFAAVGLLWLVGIANIGGLMLVQMHRRAREMAIRTAIGAARSHVIGAVMREVLIVSLISSAIGAWFATWLLEATRRAMPSLPRANEVALDWRAVAFAGGTTLLAALVFGLWPAWHATRARLASQIAAGSRGSSGQRHRLQRTLVTAQVALSVLLAASATLLVRTYYNLGHAESGFSTDQVITFHVGARWDEDRTRIGELQQQLVSDIQQLPGVEAAGFTNFLPMTGATLRFQVHVAGLAGPERNGTMTVGERLTTAGFLPALHVPLVAGNWCPALGTDKRAPLMALVNRRFADEFADHQNLIGRALTFGQLGGQPPYTIAGVIGDMVEDAPGAPVVPYVYVCDPAGSWPDPEYIVRTHDAAGTIAGIRRIVRTLDSSRAIFGMRPLSDVTDAALDQPRLSAGMLTMFASAAVLLAALGMYSLFMLLVGERTREIGVRLALGAAPRQVVQLIFTGAGGLVLLGVSIGLALTVAAERAIGALLFGVTPLDPLTLVGAALLLATVAAVAIAVPAARASRISPISVMRGE